MYPHYQVPMINNISVDKTKSNIPVFRIRIYIILGSQIQIRIRIKVEIQELKGPNWSHGALWTLAMERGGSKWNRGGSICQWPQLCINLMRSRIRIRIKVKDRKRIHNIGTR
jgi:hypothetical protein